MIPELEKNYEPQKWGFIEPPTPQPLVLERHHGDFFTPYQFITFMQLARMTDTEALELFRSSPEWQIEDADHDDGCWYNTRRDIVWKVGTSHTANGDFSQ